MTISELLRLAADRHLSPTGREPLGSELAIFSCDAVRRCHERVCATFSRENVLRTPTVYQVMDYLEWLGVDTESRGLWIYFVDPGDGRQAARHAWLYFAADLWDEGVRP